MPKSVRNVRVDDELWNAAMQRAKDEGTTNVSEIINRALRDYVAGTLGEDEHFVRVVAALTILFPDAATSTVARHFGVSQAVARGYIDRAIGAGLLPKPH